MRRTAAAYSGAREMLLRSLSLHLVARAGSCSVRGLGPPTVPPSLQISRALGMQCFLPFPVRLHLPLPAPPPHAPNLIFSVGSSPQLAAFPHPRRRCLLRWPPKVAFPPTCSPPAGVPGCFLLLIPFFFLRRRDPFGFSRFSRGTHFTLGPGSLLRPPARSFS